jgi:hypothetical protein
MEAARGGGTTASTIFLARAPLPPALLRLDPMFDPLRRFALPGIDKNAIENLSNW